VSIRSFLLCSAAVAVLVTPGCTNYRATDYPGSVIRYEFIRRESEDHLRIDPITVVGQDLALHLTHHRTSTIHERPIHQKVKVYRVEGDMTPGKEYYEPVPGEIIVGRDTSRVERSSLGDLSNEPITVDGVECRSDREGMWIDRDHSLLSRFDDMSVTEVAFELRHKRMGGETIRLTRIELLQLIGGVSNSARDVGRDGLQVKVDLPDQVKPGETFDVLVRAENRGPKYTNNLTGRTFSRHAWLDGRNFYLGDLEAGQSRQFLRRFTVPEDCAPGKVYVALGMSDTLGVVEEMQARLALRVVAVRPEAE